MQSFTVNLGFLSHTAHSSKLSLPLRSLVFYYLFFLGGCRDDPNPIDALSSSTLPLIESRLEESDGSQERISHSEHFEDGVLKLDIERLTVARDVKQRKAIGEAKRFPSHVGSLWGLASVRSRGGAVELSIRWWRQDYLVNVSTFVVSEGIRWNEWSQVTITPKDVGEWRVELFYPKRTLTLSTYTFSVYPEEAHKANLVPHSKMTSVINESDHQTTSQEELTPRPISIHRLEVARSVKRRRALGVDTRFNISDERLWGYVEVNNLERPQHIWMEWFKDNQLRSKIKVKVGVSRLWRTWSWQRLHPYDVGRWEVRVISPEGEQLAQTHFIVEP
jgi:hypothetical protein